MSECDGCEGTGVEAWYADGIDMTGEPQIIKEMVCSFCHGSGEEEIEELGGYQAIVTNVEYVNGFGDQAMTTKIFAKGPHNEEYEILIDGVMGANLMSGDSLWINGNNCTISKPGLKEQAKEISVNHEPGPLSGANIVSKAFPYPLTSKFVDNGVKLDYTVLETVLEDVIE